MKCPYCPKLFVSISSYNQHHKLLHCLKPYVCSCGRKFSLWQSFQRHTTKCNSKLDVNVGVNLDVNAIVSDDITDDITEINDQVNSQPSNSGPSSMETLPPISKPAYHILIDNFVTKLYSKPRMPRGYVQSIIDDVSDFCQNGLLASLKESLLSKLNLNEDQISAAEKIFMTYQSPFSHLRTEYRRFNYFTASGDYIPPISYKIGEIDVNDNSRLVKKDLFGQYVPLEKVLKQFLEAPNVLRDILAYVKSLENDPDVIQNFVQSKLWLEKRKSFSPDDIVIPLHTFYDDCQCNNPLGSHADKLGCTYVQIPCLPPECQSAVENIFLALVFKASYRCFGDSKAFGPLISSFKLLEDGIMVNTNDGPKKVYFLPGLLLGDNLGLNSVGGFVECFTACHYCRFCKIDKYQAYTQCTEDPALSRTKENYVQDLALQNYTLTGVKSNCVFNDVSQFHITSNYSVDVFHDLCEGVCHYTMMHILKHCIPRYFTLELLNHRIEMFQFGLSDSNRIPVLSDDFAKKEKLKMSGSETLLFVRLFGIIIGDKVPPADDFWVLYIKLCEVLDTCLSKSMSRNQGSPLRVLIHEFNSMYIKVTKDDLKPKNHNLGHYATAFEECGPMALSSTIRFESKHRTVLMPARATESRRDICRTVAVHHQLNMYYRFRSISSILPEVEFGPVCDVYLNEFSNTDFVKSLPESITLSNNVSCLASNWVKYKGTKYKSGMILLLRIDSSGGPVFGQLEEILVSDNLPLFVYSHLLCLGFDAHVHAYMVQSSDKWSCTFPHDLHDPLPLNLYSSISSEKYVPLRYAL